MVKTLHGRIITVPSKTINGDYIPGVIELNMVRGSNESPGETRYPKLYGFYPEHLGAELDDLFDSGKLTTPTAVTVTVDSLPRENIVVKKKSIFRS